MICIVVSAVVMFYILRQIEDARIRVSSSNPGSFNYIIQSDHNIDSLIIALQDYSRHRDSVDFIEQLEKEYRLRFDILWSGFQVFNIRYPFEANNSDVVPRFLSKAERFIKDYEPYMAQNYQISNTEIILMVTDARNLISQIRELNQEYFIQSNLFYDEWMAKLRRLYRFFWLISGALALMCSLLVALLFHSNIRKNNLVREAEEARNKLSLTIEELRSGRMEQKAKDSFIAAASHDLRQPLHALGFFLASLENHVNSKTGSQLLGKASECTYSLNQMFSSLLDISRLDAGIVEVNLSHVDLTDLVRALVDEFSESARKRSVNVTFCLKDCFVHTDPLLLSRIIRNLLSNAIQHSAASDIVILCNISERIVQVKISDNGCGIPEKEHSAIFREHYQLSNIRNDSAKGLGLGLFIVDRLAQLLNITLQLNSIEGKGTEFILDLPLSHANTLKPKSVLTHHPKIEKQEPVKSNVIAVVDDDSGVLFAMQVLLDDLNLDAVCALNCDTLMDQLTQRKKTPQLIIADYNLGAGQTGDVAIKRIRSELGIDIPCIIITGDISPVRAAQAQNSGFDFLHKPVQPDELSALILDLLSKSASA